MATHIDGKYKDLRAKHSSLYVTLYEDTPIKTRFLICDRRRHLILAELVINPHIVEIIDNLRKIKKNKRK